MYTFLVIVHVIIGAFMILCVLLQSGKAGGGTAFGGGNAQSVFGASGAGNFLTKTTTTCGFIFMVTSLSLTYLSSKKAGSSVLEGVPTAPVSPPALPDTGASSTTPATPATPHAETPAPKP